jgi:hypothetical protein
MTFIRVVGMQVTISQRYPAIQRAQGGLGAVEPTPHPEPTSSTLELMIAVLILSDLGGLA